MPNYDLKKESKGNLWPNNDRSGKMPQYRGHVTVTKEQARHIMSHMKNGADEVKITIAAWDNTGDDGSRWMGLKTETLPPESSDAPPPPPPPPPPPQDDFEDDIPF